MNENLEFEEKKKSKSKKVLLADFLSKAIHLDKKTDIFIAKKQNNTFQFISTTPFHPPLSKEKLIEQFGDGIYRMDLRSPSGKNVYPSTIYFKIENQNIYEIEEIEKQIEKKESKLENVPFDIEFLQKIIQSQIDISQYFELFKKSFENIISFQTESFKKIIETQTALQNQMIKQLIENLSPPEEEEEEEEIDTETLSKMIAEGKWDAVESILSTIINKKDAEKLIKLIKLGEAYYTAKKIEAEAQKKNE
ncbi:MAG: hypothetical protein NC926_08350 [Candidatus Omnitrophica bacterium]|nr:hypothetical protein [Candidatus Omnitrophota bacterium]